MASARELGAGDYWAAVPTEEIGCFVAERFSAYGELCESSGLGAMWRLAMRRHYGQDASGDGYAHASRIELSGEQGESLKMTINHTRSLVQSLLALTTSQRLAFRATASTDDPSSMEQTTLAEQIIDYELEDGGVEAALLRTAEFGVVLSEGWTLLGWDARAGDVVAVEPVEPDEEGGQPSERPIRAGELDIESLAPWDVARDFDAPSLAALRWVIVRRKRSRWALAAAFPEAEKRAAIIGAESTRQDRTSTWASVGRGVGPSSVGSTDQIYVLELYHVDGDELPGGRWAVVVGDTCLSDGALPFDRLPVFPLVPGEQMTSAAGYSSTWDILGLADAMDGILSDVLSVASAGGQPNWLAAEGSNVDVDDLAHRFRLVTYDPSAGPEPHPMMMPRPDKVYLEIYELLQRTSETIIGVNGVVRGDPDAQLKSGAALALVQSTAIQHNSALQRAWSTHAAAVASAIISRYQSFATTPRMIEITGEDEQTAVRNFKASDIASVRRVRVELGNPLMRTIAGKEQVASTLLERFPGQVTPEQYLAFLSTGRLQPLYKAARAEALGIRAENASLLRGDPVRAIVTDSHAIHVREHKAILDRPDVRANDALAARVLAHVQEHVGLYRDTDPMLLGMTGQPMPEGGAPPPQGGPMPGPGGPEMPAEGGPPPGMPPDVQPLTPGLEGPSMPQMPINPGTGERVPRPEGIQ